MRHFVTFFALFAVAIAAPQFPALEPDTIVPELNPIAPKPNPTVPAFPNLGILSQILNGLPLPQLLPQIDSLLNSVEALLPRISATPGPAGGLVITLLQQVRAILVNTLKQAEKAPNAISKAVIDQLTSILARTDAILKTTVDRLGGGLQGVISGGISGISGFLSGPLMQTIPSLLTQVINWQKVIVERLV